VFREWCLAYHHGIEITGARRNFLSICSDEMLRLLAGVKAEPDRPAATAEPSPNISAAD
jgi:hypothetical protein